MVTRAFSQPFKFFLQVAPSQCLGKHNSSANINADKAEKAVCPMFGPNSSVLVICFTKCWLCAPPLTHFQEIWIWWIRELDQNKLNGTISAAMSTLVKLNWLYALTFFLVLTKLTRLYTFWYDFALSSHTATLSTASATLHLHLCCLCTGSWVETQP